MNEDKIPDPKPGSDAAVLLGCTCPVIDNHHGRGIILNGERHYWMDDECPLHGTTTAGDPLPHSETDA